MRRPRRAHGQYIACQMHGIYIYSTVYCSCYEHALHAVHATIPYMYSIVDTCIHVYLFILYTVEKTLFFFSGGEHIENFRSACLIPTCRIPY